MTGNTEIVLLATLASGVVSGLVVTGAQAFVRRGERAADVREKRREDAARIVGPTLAVLRDIEPLSNVGVLGGNPRLDEAMAEKWQAWLTASGHLEVLGATHPDTDVAALCESVITNGTSVLASIHWSARDNQARDQAWWDDVNAKHGQALADGRSLVKAVLAQPTA